MFLAMIDRKFDGDYMIMKVRNLLILVFCNAGTIYITYSRAIPSYIESTISINI